MLKNIFPVTVVRPIFGSGLHASEYGTSFLMNKVNKPALELETIDSLKAKRNGSYPHSFNVLHKIIVASHCTEDEPFAEDVNELSSNNETNSKYISLHNLFLKYFSCGSIKSVRNLTLTIVKEILVNEIRTVQIRI